MHRLDTADRAPVTCILIRPGTLELKYTIPQNSLLVDSGDMLVPSEIAPSTLALAPTPSTTSEAPGKIISTDRIQEARRMTYDPTSKAFIFYVQEVTYSKAELGSSGISGIRK